MKEKTKGIIIGSLGVGLWTIGWLVTAYYSAAGVISIMAGTYLVIYGGKFFNENSECSSESN